MARRALRARRRADRPRIRAGRAPRAPPSLELLESTRVHHGPLGLAPWIDRVADMLEHGNGAIRQRALLEAHEGDLRAVHAQVVVRTRASARKFSSQTTTGAPA